MNMIDIYLQIFELYLLGFILGGCGGGGHFVKSYQPIISILVF